MIGHIQIQPHLSLPGVLVLFPHQLILTAGHGHEPHIGLPEDPVKVRHLHIRLQLDLMLLGQIPIGRIRKGFHPDVASLCLHHGVPAF